MALLEPGGRDPDELSAGLQLRHRPGADSYGPYRYPHSEPDAWVEQQYLPDALAGSSFYRPITGVEERLQADLKRKRAQTGSIDPGSGGEQQA